MKKLVIGNEAVARGLWEAGAGVVEIDGRHTNPSFVFLIVPTIYQECK